MTDEGLWLGASDDVYAAFVCEFDGIRLNSLNNILTIPENTMEIGVEAFRGVQAEAVILPEGCEHVSAYAFADCPELKYIIVPVGSNIRFDPEAYDTQQTKIVTN